MEASLTCAVCLGVFREPVTLPGCSHNFCKSCVLEFAASSLWTATEFGSGRDNTVSCPLCRKVSTLSGGLAALPVNTTLAEVVRLLRPSGGAKEGQAGGAASGEKSPCEEHPEYRLELFCKICERACCGRCVSLRHQGVFHSVNLLDVTFQEEKLVFFSSLKTLHEINQRLLKEISDDEEHAESILKANEDAVTSAFEEVQKTLDLKKKQLLDMVKQQQSMSKKHSEVRKVTKSLHKTTIESLLKECEKIVDDYEPTSFLQVACGLNKRMKSNFELTELCADHNEDVLRVEPQCVDVKAVLDAVSTLKMTGGSKDVSKQNGSFSFKSISRTWSHEMETNEKYCPFQDQELIYLQGQMQKISIRFVCITKMPEYQHLSYEELRLKYYEPSVVQDKKAVQIVCNNVNNNFNFKMSLTNGAKSTRLKRQDTSARERTVHSKKDMFKEKPTKTDIGRLKQKDSDSVCALHEDDSVKPQNVLSSFLVGMTSKLPSNKVEKTPKLYNDVSNKALFPNFCLGKSKIASVKKSDKNKKSCEKLTSMACFPNLLNAASIPSTSAMADRTVNTLSNTVDNAEEDMSCNSASSEEFYDASCNINPDVEDPCAQSSSHCYNYTEDDESSLQSSQH